MENNKIIIIALVVIIAALLAGIIAVMPHDKQDTKLTFESNSTLTQGDSLKIKLTDANGTAIANQVVNITIRDKDNLNDYHSVVTDDNGVGTIKIDKTPAKYDVTISYAGNDNYAACNATEKITVEENVVEATVSSQDNNQASSTHTIMGEDGYYYVVDDNGNILETLGPSSKHYPNNPNSVNYPNAEPANRYIDKSK